VCDQAGRPIILRLSAGQVSDHKGARMVLDELPQASHLIADRGYDSAWFREELEIRAIEPCIPSSRSRKVPFDYDKAIYRQRHKLENLFAKLKDWRRIATRYDRCAHTFFSAICIAATIIFWINES
jgi:putative transposase